MVLPSAMLRYAVDAQIGAGTGSLQVAGSDCRRLAIGPNPQRPETRKRLIFPSIEDWHATWNELQRVTTTTRRKP